MICEFGGKEYRNLEGFFRITYVPTKKHPWNNRVVCMDWDAFCTKCMDNRENGK